MEPELTSLAGIAFSLWGKVFIFVAAGYALGRFWGTRMRAVIRVFVAASIYVVLPIFVFALMWSSAIDWPRFGRMTLAVAGVLGWGALSAGFLARRWRWAFRDLCLPVIFMNSIYLALPINTLLFGAAGAAATLVFNIVVTLVQFTLGIWWVRRLDRSGWGEMLGMPILYATVIGTGLNFLDVRCPPSVSALSNALARLALPAMLGVLGIRMAGVPFSDWRIASRGVAWRMGGGAMAGAILSAALKLSPVESGVVILTASMPSAVNTYVLAEKFDARPSFAAAMVTLGTALSAVTVPVLGWLLREGSR
jgi:malate permease and related proteins